MVNLVNVVTEDDKQMLGAACAVFLQVLMTDGDHEAAEDLIDKMKRLEAMGILAFATCAHDDEPR